MTTWAGKHRTSGDGVSSASTAADPSLRHTDGQTPVMGGSVDFVGEHPKGTDPSAPSGGWLKLVHRCSLMD